MSNTYTHYELKVLDILNLKGIVKGLHGVTIQAMYNFEDIKKNIRKSNKESRKRPSPCNYCICSDSEIDGHTIAVPIESFEVNELNLAVHKFVEAEILAGEGLWPPKNVI